MKNKMYILLQFIIYGLEIVHAIIGHNIRPAEENEFPSVACIVRYDPTGDWQDNVICTGTLISHNFILSAQHCFDDAQHVRYEISMGSYHMEMGERYYPVWWISYDQWANINIPEEALPPINDILLIKIFGAWRDIPTSRLIAAVPRDMFGLDFTMVGCGKLNNGLFPAVLHAAEVKVIDRELCSRIVSNLSDNIIRLSSKFSCSIGVPYTQVDFGDSGGPLIHSGGVVAITIAVCPRLNNEFHASKVNVHVNIYTYQDFLNQLVTSDS